MATKTFYDINKISVGNGTENKPLTDGHIGPDRIKYIRLVDVLGYEHTVLDYATFEFSATDPVEIGGDVVSEVHPEVVSKRTSGIGEKTNPTYTGTASHNWGINESEDARTKEYTITQDRSGLTAKWTARQEGNVKDYITDPPTSYNFTLSNVDTYELYASGGSAFITPYITGTSNTYVYWMGYTDFRTNPAHCISHTTSETAAGIDITMKSSIGSFKLNPVSSGEVAELVVPCNKSLEERTIYITASTETMGNRFTEFKQPANSTHDVYEYGTPVLSLVGYDNFDVNGGTKTARAVFTRPYTMNRYWWGDDTPIYTETSTEAISGTVSLSIEGDGFSLASTSVSSNNSFDYSATSNAENPDYRYGKITASITFEGKNYSTYAEISQEEDTYTIVGLVASASYSMIDAWGGTSYPSISLKGVYKWDSGKQFTGDTITEGYSITAATGTMLTNANGQTASIATNGAVTIGTLGKTTTDSDAIIASGISLSIKYLSVSTTIKDLSVSQVWNERREVAEDAELGTMSVSPSSLSSGDVAINISYAKYRVKYEYDSGEADYEDWQPGTVIFQTTDGTLAHTYVTASSTSSLIENKLTLGKTASDKNVTITATLVGTSKTATIQWSAKEVESFSVNSFSTDYLEYFIVDGPLGHPEQQQYRGDGGEVINVPLVSDKSESYNIIFKNSSDVPIRYSIVDESGELVTSDIATCPPYSEGSLTITTPLIYQANKKLFVEEDMQIGRMKAKSIDVEEIEEEIEEDASSVSESIYVEEKETD